MVAAVVVVVVVVAGLVRYVDTVVHKLLVHRWLLRVPVSPLARSEWCF